MILSSEVHASIYLSLTLFLTPPPSACGAAIYALTPPEPRLNTQYSKHILNAQVSIRAPCCRQWFDCSECHAETQDHTLARTGEMAFACKKCKKAFRKDMANYDESDEYCPHCDNHYVRASMCAEADADGRTRSLRRRRRKR